MADGCCGATRDDCASKAMSAAAPVADSCCSGGVPVFDGLDPRYKRILWTVIAINGAMFLTEIVAGQLAGSQALKADALDFLADTVTYGLSLVVIGASIRRRATAALFKGLSLSLMAVWVFGSTLYHTLVLGLAGRGGHGGDRRSRVGGEPGIRPLSCCRTRTATPMSARSGCVPATMRLATSS